MTQLVCYREKFPNKRDRYQMTLRHGHEVLAMPGVFVHLYGKKTMRPYRKMGHVTIMGKDRTELLAKADKVKETLRCLGEEEI